MNIEIISVGTELLLGDIVNSNSQYLSKQLALLGMNVYRQVTVGDNIDRLVKCFEAAFDAGADVVITTGGLGPTADDITKESAAKYFGQEMFLDEESWEDIQEKCSKFSGSRNNIPKNNIKQAMFPLEADIIPNPNGTAPGAIFKDKSGKKRIMVMPGPPREMRSMFLNSILPLLRSDADVVFKSKYIRFFGVGESALEIQLMDLLTKQTNPTVALYAKEGEVLIRVTASAFSEEKCEEMIQEKIDEVSNICGDKIYLIGDDSISSTQTEMDNVVAKMLLERKKTISVAESCTGGLIASYLVNYSGISESLLEACVTYSNEAKIKRLGVSKDILDKYGAVSPQVAEAMAKGVAESLGSDIGISTTGVAGPDGGSDEKPVGLVYIGVYYQGKSTSIKKIFSGDRRKVRERAAREALNQVRLLLLNK